MSKKYKDGLLGSDIYEYHSKLLKKQFPQIRVKEWDELEKHEFMIWNDLAIFIDNFDYRIHVVSKWGALFEEYRALRYKHHRHRYPLVCWNKLGHEHIKVWKKMARRFL